MKLSVSLAVHNEEQTIEDCLRSIVSFADEIVVVDGASTDKTVELAKKFTQKVIKTDNPTIFHINKQKALDACTGEWILQLDADERVPDALHEEIVQTIEKPQGKHGYYIPRRNYFWGHFMKKGGQYPDYVIRLVKRGFATFPCKSVHEQIAIDGEVGYLKEPMDHISYRTKEDYWKKANTYTTLSALEMEKNNIPKTIVSWCLYNLFYPIQIFFSLFIRHKGFIDGWYGLVFAYWSALHHPIAYKKYIQMKHI
ncbi:MAG: glycosyltransferase family 2 protein [Candidatus Gottesmanbacteria bacterium]